MTIILYFKLYSVVSINLLVKYFVFIWKVDNNEKSKRHHRKRSTKVDRLEERRKRLLLKHPLNVNLTVSLKGKYMIVRLSIVCVSLFQLILNWYYLV